MKYKGNIIYDVYNILGNYKLNIDYNVEGASNDFEITRISISPVNDSQDLISFSLEDEMEDIIEECIKDFITQKEFLEIGKTIAEENNEENSIKPKLVNKNYDFSAN